MNSKYTLIIVIITLIFSGCSRKEYYFTATFSPEGILKILIPPKVDTVSIVNSKNNIVATCPAFGRKTVDMRYQWFSGEKYQVLFDGKMAGVVRAPSFRPKYRLSIHAPIGQVSHDYYLPAKDKDDEEKLITMHAHSGEKANIVFEVEKLADTGTAKVSIKVCPMGSDSANLKMEPAELRDTAILEFEFDKRLWTLQVQMPEVHKIDTQEIQVEINLNSYCRKITIACVPPVHGWDSVKVLRWDLPTDQSGVYSSRHEPGTIIMPNPFWCRIGSLFGVETEETDYFKPFTFQTLRIVNAGKRPEGIMITGEIIDMATEKESPYFRAPDNKFTGGTDKITSFVNIPAGRSEICVLPVYVSAQTPPGAYKSKITLRRTGSDRILQYIENTVQVFRGNTLFTAWTVCITLISLGWLFVVLLFYKRIVGNLGLRILVLLSLLGSLQFCLSFTGRIVSNIMYAVLGPFNCLVGGLFTEVLTYLLVTSILFLVPRVGAMTLAGIVSYIMGGILFGSFGLTDILFLGSGIAFREIFLFIFGVTKFKHNANLPAIVPMMLSLGLADAASTFTSLTLHAVFYRLFFADWYILLNVVVTGFLYTAVGVYLGKTLGQSLRKVQL